MDRPLAAIQFLLHRRKKKVNDMNEATLKTKDVTLLEILDRVLDTGVVISGDIVISVADVDLIYVGLKVLLSSVETMTRLRGAPIEGPMQEPT